MNFDRVAMLLHVVLESRQFPDLRNITEKAMEELKAINIGTQPGLGDRLASARAEVETKTVERRL